MPLMKIDENGKLVDSFSKKKGIPIGPHPKIQRKQRTLQKMTKQKIF